MSKSGSGKYVPTEGFKGGFDLDAMREVYVSGRWLSEKEFDALAPGVEKVRALGIPGLEWRITPHAASLYPKIPKTVHLRASAAAIGRSWNGPEDFYAHGIERGLVPRNALNRTVFHRVPKDP